MSDGKDKLEATVRLMDDTAFGADLEVPYMDDGPSAETLSGELAAEQTEAKGIEVLDPGCVIEDSDNDSVPRGNLANEIEEFISGVRRFDENVYCEELSAHTEMSVRLVLPVWNRFLQSKQGAPDTSAIISSDITDDIIMFNNLWLEERRDAEWTEDVRNVIARWLPEWNMFLRARAGETLVTRLGLRFTSLGFLLYIVDLVTDIGTSIYYARNGQWWRAMLTLAIVYGTVVIYIIIKWRREQIHCTGAADWLRYVASSLVNWPDLKQYGALCRLEWKLHKSPVKNVHLVPEWHERKYRVATLKFTEGVCEACPQAMLQLCLLVPDLYGAWTWTDYLRIAGASVSLCTAGAALVNMEKSSRLITNNDLPLSELVVLHIWAVPVTVSRLLSMTLLLSVHSYWALAGVALHLVLYGVDWCRTVGGPRALDDVIAICLYTLQFFITPFYVAGSVTACRVRHVIHFLVNTAATVVWALGTPLVCAHPALYTAIICFIAVLFAVGLVSMELHMKYWPDGY